MTPPTKTATQTDDESSQQTPSPTDGPDSDSLTPEHKSEDSRAQLMFSPTSTVQMGQFDTEANSPDL